MLRSSDDLFSVSSEIQADSKGSPDIPGKSSMREKRGEHKGMGYLGENGDGFQKVKVLRQCLLRRSPVEQLVHWGRG